MGPLWLMGGAAALASTFRRGAAFLQALATSRWPPAFRMSSRARLEASIATNHLRQPQATPRTGASMSSRPRGARLQAARWHRRQRQGAAVAAWSSDTRDRLSCVPPRGRKGQALQVLGRSLFPGPAPSPTDAGETTHFPGGTGRRPRVSVCPVASPEREPVFVRGKKL